MITVDRRQLEVLADRYFWSLFGRLGSLGLFLAQGPLVAAMIVAGWKGQRPDARLELFLCITAVWVGTFSACREIAAERAIYRRERMVFLGIPEYVLSKAVILGGLGAIQAGILLWIVHQGVGLEGNRLMLFGTLWLGTLVGTALGLAVSAIVGAAEQAIPLAVVAILPQLLFSRAFLPADALRGGVATAEKAMPLRWVHQLYGEVVRLPKDPKVFDLLVDATACLAWIAVFLGLACLALWSKDEGGS